MSWKVVNGDCLEELEKAPDDSIDSIVTDPPAGIGFMGRDWDKDKGGRDHWIAWMTEIATECRRVLKPGGHALVWALPRTSHWTATAWEDAGFEVRDRVSHLFGTGFPKSMDISKAIDRAAGVEPIDTGIPSARHNSYSTGSGTTIGHQHGVPNITTPATPEAKQWQGWGTALKPACEDWWLLRKPIGEKTVAKNVLKHGTGGLNIDACRIPGDMGPDRALGKPRRTDNDKFGKANATINPQSPLGRWPAHLVLDEDAAAMLDEQSGGASRFFYVAKPSKKEKEAGLDHLDRVSAGEMTDRKEGSKGLDNPRAGAGRTGGSKNKHPTVKSIALMTWLIKLITPPGGVVLDPFCGSGTTGCAAVKNGFRFIGIEQDEDFAGIASARIEHWSKADGEE
jgi:site-specific DNA-methyltransferase (adenine-specific)